MMRAVLIAFFLCLPLTASANDPVSFQRFSQGTGADMVRERLLAENQDYATILGRAPSHAIAYHDLNGDRTPEMIVRIDDEYNFCDDDYWCDTRVFVYEGTELIQIGQFPAGDSILISDNTTSDIRNLLVQRKDERYDLYVWQNNAYTKVTMP